jgi:hypothetical protein
MRMRRNSMARKSRYLEYAKYASKGQAEKPVPSVKSQKSVLGRLSQMKEKVNSAKSGAEASA